MEDRFLEQRNEEVFKGTQNPDPGYSAGEFGRLAPAALYPDYQEADKDDNAVEY